jgi:hypothetical protein
MMQKRDFKPEFNDIFQSIFGNDEQRMQASRNVKLIGQETNEVYILIGKLGMKPGQKKILGVYPTSEQCEERAEYCKQFMSTLFREYMVAKVVVGSNGGDCNFGF